MGCLKLHINPTEPTLSVAYRKKGQKPLKIRGSYYPFGLKHKGYNDNVSAFNNGVASRWKYNGKELEEELGVNWQDYGARRYDNTLGRWMSIDPLAEKYETASPFNYVLNNPVNAIDPDGRLVIFVNGLLFKQALGHKTTGFSRGKYVGHYAYPPPRNLWRNEPTMFDQSITTDPGGYWGNIDNTIGDYYGDHNFAYINASDDFHSQAQGRFAQGQASGLEIIEGLKNGTIELENEETIKIVGHSQGAAFAAGILSVLANSDYASLVEAGIYLSPHQPGDFSHPDGIFGAQFSTRTDQISSGHGFKGKFLNAFFNGGSNLAEIKGTDFLFIRPSHDEEHGGHGVQTWQETLDTINNFLNDNGENQNN